MCLRAHKEGISLELRVQPRSSRTGPIFMKDKSFLKWGIKSAPVDGKANAELINAVAELFVVPRLNVEVLKGQLSRTKVLLVKGIDLANARALLAQVAEE